MPAALEASLPFELKKIILKYLNSHGTLTLIVMEINLPRATRGSFGSPTLSEDGIISISPHSVIENKHDSVCFTEKKKLFSLVEHAVGRICQEPKCGKRVYFQKYFKGAALFISWKCSRRHYGKWQSVGDEFNLKLASSLLYSGSSFKKVRS